MSALMIFHQENPHKSLLHSTNRKVIREELGNIGIRFELWPTKEAIGVGSSQEQIYQAYKKDIDRLISEDGYQSWDIAALSPEHPDKVALRQKFLAEHSHNEDEVRYFVSGKGLFSLHIDEQVYCILCERGDFISVPAHTLHWFDMGETPHFIALRFFNSPDGWVATYSGNALAANFPTLEQVVNATKELSTTSV